MNHGGDTGPAAGRDASDEDALVAGLRAGDEAAFETLVRAYGPRMLKVAQRFLRNREEARDALQDSLLSVYRNIDGFEHASKVSTWLHRIVVNTALKRLRSRRVDAEESIEPLLPTYKENGDRVHAQTEWAPSLDAILQRRETRELVRRSIDRLPDTHRTILLLRDIEEFDTAESARALGITENAVKIRLHRARIALRNLLEPHVRGGVP